FKPRALDDACVADAAAWQNVDLDISRAGVAAADHARRIWRLGQRVTRIQLHTHDERLYDGNSGPALLLIAEIGGQFGDLSVLFECEWRRRIVREYQAIRRIQHRIRHG